MGGKTRGYIYGHRALLVICNSYVTLPWFPLHCISLGYGNHALSRSLGALQF